MDNKDQLDWRLGKYISVLNIDTNVINASYDISDNLKNGIYKGTTQKYLCSNIQMKNLHFRHTGGILSAT